MSRQTIPAREIITCDACGVQNIGTAAAVRFGRVGLEGDGSHLFGDPECKDPIDYDLCGDCYEGVREAIRAALARRR